MQEKSGLSHNFPNHLSSRARHRHFWGAVLNTAKRLLYGCDLAPMRRAINYLMVRGTVFRDDCQELNSSAYLGSFSPGYYLA